MSRAGMMAVGAAAVFALLTYLAGRHVAKAFDPTQDDEPPAAAAAPADAGAPDASLQSGAVGSKGVRP